MGVERGEQGWCSGESARLPPMCPGLDSRTRRHMWVEFVVGSLPCSERFFPGYSGFPLSLKTRFLNSNSILECTDISERVLVNSWCSVGKQITVFFYFTWLIYTSQHISGRHFPLRDAHILRIWNTLSFVQSTLDIQMCATVEWLQFSV